MKFITTRSDEDKEELFIFPKSIDHDAMAEALDRIRNQTHGNWRRVFRDPISAGFIDKNWMCYGNSETLNLVARPEDTELLRKQMGIF